MDVKRICMQLLGLNNYCFAEITLIVHLNLKLFQWKNTNEYKQDYLMEAYTAELHNTGVKVCIKGLNQAFIKCSKGDFKILR